jgi:type I restriction enzyme S subunit
MMLIRPCAATAPAFLELVLNSPVITQLAKEQTTGGAAPRVNVATLEAVLQEALEGHASAESRSMVAR